MGFAPGLKLRVMIMGLPSSSTTCFGRWYELFENTSANSFDISSMKAWASGEQSGPRFIWSTEWISSSALSVTFLPVLASARSMYCCNILRLMWQYDGPEWDGADRLFQHESHFRACCGSASSALKPSRSRLSAWTFAACWRISFAIARAAEADQHLPN